MNRLVLRRVRPADEPGLVAFYDGLSLDSRRARFMCSGHGVDAHEAHDMCVAAQANDAGFVAELRDGTQRRLVGHVSLSDDGSGSAEIGIVVADEYQGSGIGRRLFDAAVSWAEHAGIRALEATAFTDNWRVLRLLQGSSHPALVRDAGSGVTAVTIQLAGDARTLRAA